MALSFSQIPANRRTPGTYIEIDSSRAVRGLQGMPHRALALGQKLATGQTAQLEPVLITDPEQAARAFGRGSMLHAECATFRAGNETTELWAVGIDDAAAGVAAVKSVTIGKLDAGAAFGAEVLNLYVGARRVRVPVAPDDSPADVVAALAAATAHPMMPAILSVDGADDAKLLATAKHKGAVAGSFDVRVNYHTDEVTPGNLTATVAVDTAGAGDPTIDAALAAVDSEWWTEVILPWTDGANYAAMDAFLRTRFSALNMQDGNAFTVRPGTMSELNAWGESDAVNSEFITTLPTWNSPTPSWEIAASYAGVAAAQTAIDPVRQLRTLALPGVLPPAMTDRPSGLEVELLLNAGISAVDFEGGAFRLSRCITNYQVNALGAEDTAYLDLVTLTGLAYLRWSERNRIELRFPRHKLASDGTRAAPGQAVVTPKTMRGELIALYREWEEAGLTENTSEYVERLIVERDGGDPNRLNALQAPDLVNNFRVFAALMQFRL